MMSFRVFSEAGNKVGCQGAYQRVNISSETCIKLFSFFLAPLAWQIHKNNALKMFNKIMMFLAAFTHVNIRF